MIIYTLEYPRFITHFNSTASKRKISMIECLMAEGIPQVTRLTTLTYEIPDEYGTWFVLKWSS